MKLKKKGFTGNSTVRRILQVPSEINELVNLIKNTNNNDALSKKLRKQELSYLIKDESGISDKSVSEFVNLMTPSEEDTRDTLEELGLKHLIHKK